MCSCQQGTHRQTVLQVQAAQLIMWTQVAPGEWICHNSLDAVEGMASAHREEPEPELRIVAPMSDSSGRKFNEGSQLTVTGECTRAGSLTPARSDGGNSAADAPHQSAGNPAHHPVPSMTPPHSPVGHKTEVSKEPEQTETPQLPVRVINLVGPDAYANTDTLVEIITFDTSKYTPPTSPQSDHEPNTGPAVHNTARGHSAAMAIDLTETDDDSEDQAGYKPDLDQHSLPETADSAPGSGPVTPAASLAAGGFSNEDWQGGLEQSPPEWHTPHPNTGYLDNIDRAGSPSVSPQMPHLDMDAWGTVHMDVQSPSVHTVTPQCTQNDDDSRTAPQSSPLGTALGQAQVFAQHTGQTATGSLTDQEPWASHLAQPQPSWSTNMEKLA